MSSPFRDDEILVGARRKFVMDLVIPYEIVSSRGDNEYRDRNDLNGTWGRIVAGTVINAIHRICGPNRVRT